MSNLPSGFKATMTYEQCLRDRNSTLVSIFGTAIPQHLPANGTILNKTHVNGGWSLSVMPELPECDLQKELDNVS